MEFNFERALSTQVPSGKALPNHPAWNRPEEASYYVPGAKSSKTGLISQRQAPVHLDVYGGRQAIDWVYDCIGLYSDSVSTAPYALTKPDGTKLVRSRTANTPPEYEVGPAELYKLLDKPNPYMLYDELMSLLVIDLLLVGNHYWYKWNWDTPAAALYRLSPSHVKVRPGPYGPLAYEYQPNGSARTLKLDPANVVHFKRPNPHSQWYGMGVVQGGGRAMDLELAITDTMASYYENRADPSLIVQSERRVPRDVFNKLRQQLRMRASGTDKAGELLVLEAGLKAQTLSNTARDALFAELSTMSRDRVLAKFRASPMIFGLMEVGSGSNKVSDARREFDNNALRPFMKKIQNLVTAGVTESFGVEYKIDYRQILPPEEAIKVGESVAKVPGVKVREVRAQYQQFGIEESTGDPEIDNLVLNVPGEELDENGQNGLADQPLSGEAGRPPDLENTAAFGVANARVREADGETEGKALSIEEVEARLEELSQKAVSDGRDLPTDEFAQARKTDIDALVASATQELRDAATELERGLLDKVEGKALKTSDIVSRIKSAEAWQKFKTRVQNILERTGSEAAASGLMHSGLVPEEDLDYDEIARSVINRPEGIRSIMRTLRDRIANRVKETRDADGERQDFEAAIREVIGGWIESQAATIADTEAVQVYNEATLTAAEASGVTEVLVTDGEDHDEPCVNANGQVWTLDQARENRLEHPRCRRAFLPLPVAEVS